MFKRIVVGITGASGVIYAVRMLAHLKEADCETHLILSDAGRLNIEIETGYRVLQVEDMADYTYDYRDIAAAPASATVTIQGLRLNASRRASATAAKDRASTPR